VGVAVDVTLTHVMRILDVDLDFFVHPVAHFRNLDDLSRLSDDEYDVWPLDEASAFLADQCGLSGRLPGWAIERHGEAFRHWHEAIASGRLKAPFSVVHVDAHADLGLGEPVHEEIMGELLFMPVDQRAKAASRVTDGSYLAYACAAGWFADLTYVHSTEKCQDLHPYHMKNWDVEESSLQLKAVQRSNLNGMTGKPRGQRPVEHLDPEIPFRRQFWRGFQAEDAFDAIVICRSPNFTPPAADHLYDMICDRYVKLVD
jgi:hypothetical protein